MKKMTTLAAGALFFAISYYTSQKNLGFSLGLLAYVLVAVAFSYRTKIVQNGLRPNDKSAPEPNSILTGREYFYHYLSGLILLMFGTVSFIGFFSLTNKTPSFGSFSASLWITFLFLYYHFFSMLVIQEKTKAIQHVVKKTNYKRIGIILCLFSLVLLSEKITWLFEIAILAVVPLFVFPLLSAFVVMGIISRSLNVHLKTTQAIEITMIKKIQTANVLLILFCFGFFAVSGASLDNAEYSLQMDRAAVQDKSDAAIWLGIFRKPFQTECLLTLLKTPDPKIARLILHDYKFSQIMGKRKLRFDSEDLHMPLSRVMDSVTSSSVFEVYLNELDKNTIQEKHLSLITNKLTQLGLTSQSKIGKHFFCDQLVNRSQQNQMMENYFNTKHVGQFVSLEGLLGMEYKRLSKKLKSLDQNRSGRAPASTKTKYCAQL